jgi:cytochrome c-type biogenesis protein CcmH
MVLWSLAIVVTAIACAALYYAAAGPRLGVASAAGETALEAHFRQQLQEIGADAQLGLLAGPEAEAARRELAREYLKSETERGNKPAGGGDRLRVFAPLALVVVVGIAFATYACIGHPDLAAQPLADRPEAAAAGMDMTAALARIEEHLQAAPDDLKGWQVIAPAYMQLGRFPDAERAFRRVLALAPSPDAKVDLAEALLMQSSGQMTGEPLALLQQAVATDPGNIRARFYLAGEATRNARYADAKAQWSALLALAKGDESWVTTARQGLDAAEAGLSGKAATPDAAAISGMVEGLNQRLLTTGGSLAEWTQLVRSRLVLGDKPAAQAAYDAAVKAYPDATQRSALDALAKEGGLAVAGGTP